MALITPVLGRICLRLAGSLLGVCLFIGAALAQQGSIVVLGDSNTAGFGVGAAQAFPWDRIEENVFADDVTNALANIFPNDPPRFLARTPHGYHDTALIRSELEDAGFTRVVIETRAEQSRASSPRLPAVAYCQGTVLRSEIEARDAGKLEVATDYAASAIADKAWQRRGCCQNSGTRNHGCGLGAGTFRIRHFATRRLCAGLVPAIRKRRPVRPCACTGRNGTRLLASAVTPDRENHVNASVLHRPHL